MPITAEQRILLRDYITGTFIWDFKKGDNIVYNFEILWALYEAKKHYRGNKQLYNKPIIITIISIIECILEDFVKRIQTRTSDPLPNITPQVIDSFKYKITGQTIAIKKLSKFNHYIDSMEKHNIFGLNQSNYQALRILRDIRNKVHIQDSFEDEYKSFTETNLNLSQAVLKGVLKQMIVKYPRRREPIFEQSSFEKIFPWVNI